MEHLTAMGGVRLSGEIVERRKGLWWSLDPSDYVCRDLFWAGAKDAAQVNLILEVMKPGGVMFDLGANFGYYSVVVADALKQNCIIHAFEPNPAALTRLRKNLALNHLHCVSSYGVGVWDCAGSTSVIDVDGNSGAAHLVPGGKIPVVTLDGFCKEHAVNRLDVIKIDVEGSELRVLRGALRTLETLRPAILLELNSRALHASGASVEEILDLLDGLRYRIETVRRRRLASRDMLTKRDDKIVDVFCTSR
jgi:FkbM family methyltransferase